MPADPNRSLSLQDQQEEEELQRAIALSKGEQLPAQENGITGTGQQFGPANGLYSDKSKWAMTVSNTTAQEILENPAPKYRQRAAEEPAFLRPSDRSGYLSSLLTIYHSIPLAREALLLPSVRQASYGYDSQWWSGAPINASRVVSLDDLNLNRGELAALVHQTQRLMAFLDNTNRSYGSADALADLEQYRNFPAQTALSRFLETWTAAAMTIRPDEQLTQIFTSVASKNFDEEHEPPTSREFQCAEPNPSFGARSLYDLLDTAIWCDSHESAMNDVWIDHVAEVFTIRLSDLGQGTQGRGVKIPAIWYPDRYMESCKNLSWNMRARMLELKVDVLRLERVHDQCAIHRTADGTFLDVRATLLAAADAAEIAVKGKAMPNGLSEEEQPLLSGRSRISGTEGSDCARELRDMVARIENKMRLLKEQQRQAMELCNTVSQQLIQPSSAGEPPTNKYTLRGVSTKPHVTYVLRPAAQDLIDFDGETNLTEKDGGAWQWWRISFSRDEARPAKHPPALGPPTQAEVQAAQASAINASGPYSDWKRKIQQSTDDSDAAAGFSLRKVREYEVLKAAREEHDEVLLVYANENAVNFKGSSLAPELAEFVDTDNRAFERELRDEQVENGEIASLDQDVEDQIRDLNRGMTQMTTMSPKREAEDQPSPPPKRNKGQEDHDPADVMFDDPPPYQPGGNTRGQEMLERTDGPNILPGVRPNRIGQHAERMMERIGEEAGEDEIGLEHVEYAKPYFHS